LTLYYTGVLFAVMKWDHELFLEAIRQFSKDNNLTRVEVSTRAELADATVGHWLSKQRENPDLESILKVLAVINIPITNFIRECSPDQEAKGKRYEEVCNRIKSLDISKVEVVNDVIEILNYDHKHITNIATSVIRIFNNGFASSLEEKAKRKKTLKGRAKAQKD